MIKDGATFPEDLSQPAPSGSAFNTREKIQYPEILPPDPQKLWKSTETIDALVALRNLYTLVKTWSSDVTVGTNQHVYLIDCTAGNRNVYLMDAKLCNGIVFAFKKIDSTTNQMILTPKAGQLIDGNATLEIDTQYTCPQIVSDGLNYYII